MKISSILLIKGYQHFLSPMLGTRCRFFPSCSSYSIESIEKKGFWIGIFQACARLGKCHPFHAGGYDPVILKKVNKTS